MWIWMVMPPRCQIAQFSIMQSAWIDLLSWISAPLILILLQQVAQQSRRHRVCGVRWRCVLQQRTHTKHCQIWPEDAHQERRGHYHKCQLSWHIALPLGREIWYWPGCGWEWPLGNLRHWGQQRATGGQPGGRVVLQRRGWKVDYKWRIISKSNLRIETWSQMSHVNDLLLRLHKWDTEMLRGQEKGSHSNPFITVVLISNPIIYQKLIFTCKVNIWFVFVQQYS